MSEQINKLTQQTLASELAILWATNQFFTTLQNIMLEKELTPDNSLAELHTKMEALGADATVDNNTLIELQRALQRARANLAIIDSRISVAEIRRFFERMGESEPVSLRHIARYYLNKPAKDDNDRDKIDLLLTRLCSITTTSPTNQKVRQVIEKLEETLEDLCRSKRAIELESVQVATIAKLHQLSKVILEARSFNALIEGKLLSHLRDFKITLGEDFYVPMVLAEIIRVNVSVHNKFQELYNSEQARLRMETARMLQSLKATGRHIAIKDSSHPLHSMLSQLGSHTAQMQQFLQELKRNLTDQILQDRVTRATIEADGNSITQLIASLEESLKRSRDLLMRLQDVQFRSGDQEARHQ